MEKQNIKAVCSNDEARQYFKDKGLTYSDITEGDILALVMLLNKYIKTAVKDKETSVDWMSLSKKVDIKMRTNGTMLACFIYVNSNYFTRRECISFNYDGFIGFAGWADQKNTNPILRAFLKWCDYLASQKEDDEAFMGAVELAMDWNIDLTEGEVKRYRELQEVKDER